MSENFLNRRALMDLEKMRDRSEKRERERKL
jgi:hypothetical protein